MTSKDERRMPIKSLHLQEPSDIDQFTRKLAAPPESPQAFVAAHVEAAVTYPDSGWVCRKCGAPLAEGPGDGSGVCPDCPDDEEDQ